VSTHTQTQFPVQGDGEHILLAVRLGWGIAELRGRNWPSGPPGGPARVPPNAMDALPLRAERSPTELRIEAQAVVEYLAAQLRVNEAQGGTDFGTTLEAKAQLLYHVQAMEAARALESARQALIPPADQSPDAGAALAALQQGQTAQQAVVDARQQAVAAAQATLSAAQEQAAELVGQPGDAGTAAAPAVAAATAALELTQAEYAGETAGLQALTDAIADLQQAIAAGPQTAPAAGATAVTSHLAQLAQAAQPAWTDLASLIWRFDAHIQDELAAQSETRAMGYQLGRGLAETYWALDPVVLTGASGWGFLLGPERCGELIRLAGRLGSYMNEYTAPAVASSVQVWQAVAAADDWRGPGGAAAPALYMQIRRWFELIILGQDPTTLVKPSALFRSWRTAGRAFRFFWPELLMLVVGLTGLAFLIVYAVHGGSALEKTVSGLAAGIGAVAAGLAGAFKSAGQALFKRLRQDTYTDLIAVAVQTAPKPPQGNRQLQKALAKRDLTPATPN
jgi:hypothetical protein